MIDAHFHIWQLARGDYGWLTPALGRIHRDVSLDDWRGVSRTCGVTGGVVVQAAPTQAETAFLLQQAEHAPDVLGVVGWTDLLAPDAPARIGALAQQPKLKALRPMLQDIPDPDWILQPALEPAIHAMQACDLAFDALVKPVHLPRIRILAQRHPALRIVVDHGAKPAIAAGQWQPWADDLAALASAPQVVCKWSGLWTEAAPQAPVSALAPCMGHVLACFGANRVMWGSDWPVLERAGDYADWHAAASGMLSPTQRQQVMDAVARRVYRL
jgi:L-fuconolactonase